MSDEHATKQTKHGAEHLKPWQWKKGQSGNLKGRPKGKTMKEYTRDYLASMTDEERQEFLEGLPKEVVWKMSEGNPDTKTDLSHELSSSLISLMKHGTTQQDPDPGVSEEDS